MSIRPSLSFLALLMTASCGAHAFDDDASQRWRIEHERAEVNARARAGEAACAERFVVSSCLAQVRAERRAAIQKLDHQRALLDDAQRKRRAADRQARISERQDAAARADEARQPPPATGPSRAAEALPPAASLADPVTAAAPLARRRHGAAAANETAVAARRAESSKRRAEEAAAHRAAVEQKNRVRDAKRPPSPALPVPPATAASASGR
jgi:colicin import membrane protein